MTTVQEIRACAAYAFDLEECLRVLLDRVEDVRSGQLEPMCDSVTDAMVDARVALDSF